MMEKILSLALDGEFSHLRGKVCLNWRVDFLSDVEEDLNDLVNSERVDASSALVVALVDQLVTLL